jgi:hypothetical protein
MSLAILATIARCVESLHHYGLEDIFVILAMVCRLRESILVGED